MCIGRYMDIDIGVFHVLLVAQLAFLEIMSTILKTSQLRLRSKITEIDYTIRIFMLVVS